MYHGPLLVIMEDTLLCLILCKYLIYQALSKLYLVTTFFHILFQFNFISLLLLFDPV